MQEEQLARRNRVFALILVTFSAVCLIIGGINLATGSYYYYVSGLGSMGISALGVIIGAAGFRAAQRMKKAEMTLYALALAIYAVGYVGGLVLLSFLEYRRYLRYHSWEVKTSLSLIAFAIFLTLSAAVCGFGCFISLRLAALIRPHKSDLHELEPILERQEDSAYGSSSRNPMTTLPE